MKTQVFLAIVLAILTLVIAQPNPEAYRGDCCGPWVGGGGGGGGGWQGGGGGGGAGK
nr:glycine-rich selenoprotein [Bactrocera oleae]